MHSRRTVTGAIAIATIAAVGFLTPSGAGADDQTRTVSGDFDLLSYNVAGLPGGLSKSEPEINHPLISPLLNAYDLVLTQEDFVGPTPPVPGLEFFHEPLVAQLALPHRSTPMAPPMQQDPAHPDALLGDGLNFFSRFPLGTTRHVTWNDCYGVTDHSNDCLAAKGFAVTTVELESGVTVDVYTLHADAGGSPEDQAARASNFAQLTTYINTHSTGRAVIVGGDTNLHTEREDRAQVWRAFLEDTGLSDVCDVVDCGADADVIDKVAFRSSDGLTLDPNSHVFERDRFTRSDDEPLSDHDPLHVEFSYTAEVRPTTTTTALTTSTTTTPPDTGEPPAAPPAAAVHRDATYTG